LESVSAEAAREALYRRLYAVWPEWTWPIDMEPRHGHGFALLEISGRVEFDSAGRVRVNMRLAA
jgi:hypothetical protein